MTNDEDANNPLDYNNLGGEYWRAPEQRLYVGAETLRPKPGRTLREKMNVWGIGACMIRLMDHKRTPTAPIYDDPDDPERY